jgi:hypothetical protein
MPGGIRINGEPVYQSGVYVEGKYTTQPPAVAGEGVVAVILDLPVLEPVSQYLSTSKTALLNMIAKGDPTIEDLAAIGYNPTKNRIDGPTGILLISPTPSTAAYGFFLDGGNTTACRLDSKIFGTRGNRTVVSYVEDTVIGGGTVTISNLGADTETIKVPSETGALSISYTYPVPHTMQPNTAYGFGSANLGSGTVSAEKTGNVLNVTFVRTLTANAIVSNTHVSWYPDGPVTGVLTATATAGSAWNNPTTLKVLITGIDSFGVPHTETLTLAPNNPDGATYDTDVSANSTTSWSKIDDVKCYPNDNGRTLTGTVRLSGRNFTFNNPSTTVSEAIKTLGEGKGFSASTSSNRASDIKVVELDNLASTALPASFAATMWSLVDAINSASILVRASLADTNGYRNIPYDQTVTLANGSSGTPTNDDWQAALDEARYADVTDIVVFSTSSTIHQKLAKHVEECWGKYQSERIGHYAVDSDLSFNALKSQAALVNSPNLRRWLDTPTFVSPTGATKEYATYWLAYAAACASNGDRRRTQNAWQPNIVSFRRNSALRTPTMVDELIKLGYNVLVQPNGRPAKLARELSCWTKDNDAFKTESGSPRSQVEIHRGLRAVAEGIVESSLNIEAATASIPAAINDYLDAQVRAGRIVAFDSAATAVDASDPLVLEVVARYQPRGSKSFVKITAQVARVGA